MSQAVAEVGRGSTSSLNARIPAGAIENKWDEHRFEMKLVNPANKRKFEILVVGTGLAGASAAASLAELGYQVRVFCLQDSPRRAHSIAAQGGINAAKNYPNDGDSVYRLFYDTVKGGDYRSREANVYRLAQISNHIIDHCVAQGVPFAREYGGTLANRSFGGAQVSRTFYARGQTGQQLLLGAYQSMMRQVHAGNVTLLPWREMLELVVIDGNARGLIMRNLRTGALERYSGAAVVLATGGYSNVFYLSTNAKSTNVNAAWRCHKKGAFFANPCYTQIHPTCLPQQGESQAKLTLMSESLRNDGRVWVPKEADDTRAPNQIPEDERDYYLEREFPSFGNLVPRDVASRAAKRVCDAGFGVGATKRAVFLDFGEAIGRLGREAIENRYGNLFDMYEEITAVSPYEKPMMIYPAPHYTMGGLWVDYNLMSTVPGLFILGEANFSDHGANRLGASALMQGLADGYFVIPSTISHHLATAKFAKITTGHSAFSEAEVDARNHIEKILSVDGSQTTDAIHRKLGRVMWNQCGMARNAKGLSQAIGEIRELRDQFWNDVRVPGRSNDFNMELVQANKLADFLEFAELMVTDALHRAESCGGHFREEFQHTEDDAEVKQGLVSPGAAKRDDENFSYVAAWEFQGVGKNPNLHREPLTFEYVKPTTRSYK